MATMTTTGSGNERKTGEAAVREPSNLWRHGDFNKLWAGQSVSALGSELTTLVLPLTAILTLHAGALQVGYLEGARTVAVLLLMLLAGAIVDRFRRRPMMICTDLVRAAAIGSIPLLAFIGHLTMVWLYIASLVVGAMQVLFDISRIAYLPTLVTGEHLIGSNSRLSATESLGGIFGSSLGGFLATVFRPAYVLLGDAVSFVFSAASILAIRKPEPALEPAQPGATWSPKNLGSDIGAGIKITYTNRYLAPLAFNGAGANFGSMVILTLFILYANRQLHISPTWIGVIYAFGSAGGVAGAVLTTWASNRFGFGIAMLGSMIVYRSLVFTPLVSGPRALEVTFFCLIWFLTVFGVVMSNISAGALRQYLVPASLQGRVTAASRALQAGTIPLGALAAGFLGQEFGLRTAILIGALIMPLPLLWVVFSPSPWLKRLDDAPAGNLGEGPPKGATAAGGGDRSLAGQSTDVTPAGSAD
jgi:MFS family permease